MLAISSKHYTIPVKAVRNGDTYWMVTPVQDEYDYEVRKLERFNYTLLLHSTDEPGEVKLTFNYDGKHVKPSPRTLRKYGANNLQQIVSILSRNEEVNLSAEELFER